MRLIPIPEISAMEDGEAIPAFRGTIKQLYERSSGENDHGPWSFQNLVVTDGKVEVRVKLKDKEEVPKKAKGKSIYVESHRGDKGMTGIKIKEELYQNKPRKLVYVTASATVTILDAKAPTPAPQAPVGSPEEQGEAPSTPPPASAPASAPAPEGPTDNEDPRGKQEPPQPPKANDPPKGVQSDKQRLHAADLTLVRMANLWRRCHAVMRKTSADFAEVHGEPLNEETIQSGTSTLFIQMAKDGQHHAMPAELLPFKKPAAPPKAA